MTSGDKREQRSNEELFEAALGLPPAARAALAGILLESLDETVDENAEALWAEEIERRARDMDRGTQGIPWSKARKAILGSG